MPKLKTLPLRKSSLLNQSNIVGNITKYENH